MKVHELVDRFTIDPHKDIYPYFSRVGELNLDASNHKGCFCCGNKVNQTFLKSVAWTSVQYCWKCQSLNVVIHGDRMGGTNTDTIYCHKEITND